MNTELVRDLMVGGGDGQPNSSVSVGAPALQPFKF